MSGCRIDGYWRLNVQLLVLVMAKSMSIIEDDEKIPDEVEIKTAKEHNSISDFKVAAIKSQKNEK